ncbi:putative polyketide synthase [Xylaria cf. heliscus]|nr:putative polyketide synthase [Xylaria cf. heliscus]
MSCRFPGEATDPSKLWDMVANHRSAWSEIPSDRFNPDAFYHPNADHIGTHNVRGAHFLKGDIATWDASFFNFTAEAARAMDPQFRLLMETTFEALETAGLSVESIAGSDTSVYAGAFFRDYESSFIQDAENLPRFFMTGTGSAMASNRISHFFDLRGASLTVDTGCSTTLAALHLACQSIRSGESKLSIVGGANLILNPNNFISMSNLGMLGPTGKCFSFDSRAEGFGRGEGIAAIIIKSLDDAIRDGDPIRAIIRETALNQDGKTPGITLPSQEAQEDIIRQCYLKAGLDPLHTTYVEAHGTGTKTGDPIEARAIGTIIGQNRTPDRPLLVGSIKSNIGHLESSSGLAAIIKVALSFQNGLIPPSINFETPNPAIDFESLGLKVPTKLEKWPEYGLQRASVSNFGYGGTNTHVIMEHPKYLTNGNETAIANDTLLDESRYIFILSAKDKPGCLARATQLREYLGSVKSDVEEAERLANLAFTLGQRRSKFDWVTAVSARTVAELSDKLCDTTIVNQSNAPAQPRLGFVFTGQGAQWYAMGRGLRATYPVFAALLGQADKLLRELGAPWSLIEELERDENSTRVNQPELSFPLSVALQICLVQLLRSWGIHPTTVTGHSSGEISAAYAAGAIDLQEALAISYIRGALTQNYVRTTNNRGGMVAVGLGPEDAREVVQNVASGKLVVACVNSPSSVTISGDITAIEELETKFKDNGQFIRRLKVESAYHSHHMAPIAKDYLALLTKTMKVKNRRFSDGILFSSPVTGEVVDDANELGPGHWVKNLLQPVLFSDCLQRMIRPTGFKSPKQTVDFLLEIGPHGALAGPIRQILTSPQCKGLSIAYGTCLSRGTDAIESAQNLAGSLIGSGYPINVEAINFPRGTTGLRVIHDLPSYPWNHSIRYWEEPLSNTQLRRRQHPPHDLLGVSAKEQNSLSPTWRHVIRVSDVPWVQDHCVQSRILYPAAGCISMVIEAMHQFHKERDEIIDQYVLGEVEILRAIVVNDTVDVQLSLQNRSDDALDAANWKEFHIYSATAEDGWVEHCKGFVSVKLKHPDGNVPATGDGIISSRPDHEFFRLARRTDPAEFFDNLRAVGIEHGPAFQNILDIVARRGEALARFQIADIKSLMPAQHQQRHVIHPTTLDSLFQMGYTPLTKAQRAVVGTPVPRSIKSLHLSADVSSDPGHVFQNHGKLLGYNSQGFDVNISVFEEDPAEGTQRPSFPLIQLNGVHYQSLGRETFGASDDDSSNKLCMHLEWKPDMSLISPERIERSLVATLDASEASLIGDLRRATYLYIHDALQTLSDSDIHNFEWHQRALYDWMIRQEERAKLDQLDTRSSKWSKITPGVKQMFLDKVSAGSSNGRALRVIGEALVDILRGKAAPLDLLMQDKLLHILYETMLRVHRSLKQITDLVELFAHKNPRAKILEIGAGTGSGTVAALKALGGGDSGISTRFARYDFTDISAGWGDLIRYEKLDVEQDPAEQGFEDSTYDLIIARTMSHLIMMETTQDTLDVQLIFGTLPGWWLSEEPERKDSPNLPLDMWERVLKESGFTGIDLEVKDCEDTTNYSLSVIMSTAAVEPAAAEIPYPEIAIVYTQPPPPTSWLDSLSSKLGTLTSRKPIVGDLQLIDAKDKLCIFVGEVNHTILHDMEEPEFDSLKKMVLDCNGLIWVARGAAVESTKPQGAMHIGFLRTLRLEYVNKPIVSLDLDPNTEPWTMKSISAIAEILGVAVNGSSNTTFTDNEFALRDDTLLIPRVQEDTNYEKAALRQQETELQPFMQPTRELKLEVGTEGLLDSLRFSDVHRPEAESNLSDNMIEIEPRAFGLNFRDVMVAMGGLQEKAMGFECSGVVTQVGSVAGAKYPLQVGDRVMAIMPGDGWASRIRVPWTQVGRIPDSMTFEEAASVPVVWVTVWHSLVNIGRLQRGETILIHAATGGVGQAAIMLAQHIGAKIFCTVSTPEKRDMVVETYGIPADRIFSSRDDSFAANTLAKTSGRGVDVVLNSLAGPLLDASWKCVATFGRFLEIGKRDIQANKSLPMRVFQDAVSFAAIDVIHLMRYKGDVVAEAIKEVLHLFEHKCIRPVYPVTAYPMSDIQLAYRKMQAGQHRGKIVVVPQPGDRVPVVPQTRSAKLDSKSTYLLVGGVQGLGQAIAQWAVERGARNLIIISRSVASNTEAIEITHQLSADGCRVKLCSCDVADWSSLAETLNECRREMPPIRGVIQGAVVLDDSPFESMSLKQWHTANRPKVQATLNLHDLLQDGAEELDFFIMLSSIVSTVGNANQANYAAGSAFQDAFARCQRNRGLPYMSIDIGVVRSLGRAARAKGVVDYLVRSGFRAMDVDDVLDVLEYAVCNLADIQSRPVHAHDARIKKVKADEEPLSQIITGPASFNTVSGVQWRSDARFISLKRIGISGGSRSHKKVKTSYGEFSTLVTECASFSDVIGVICTSLTKKLAEMFMRPDTDFDSSQPLSKYGVDSLVAIELRNWLVAVTKADVSLFDVLQSKSLAELALLTAGKSTTVAQAGLQAA